MFAGEDDNNDDDDDDHHHLLQLLLHIYFRSSKRLHNPHLRAKLAEALAGLLPRQTTDELGVKSLVRLLERNVL